MILVIQTLAKAKSTSEVASNLAPKEVGSHLVLLVGVPYRELVGECAWWHGGGVLLIKQ